MDNRILHGSARDAANVIGELPFSTTQGINLGAGLINALNRIADLEDLLDKESVAPVAPPDPVNPLYPPTPPVPLAPLNPPVPEVRLAIADLVGAVNALVRAAEAHDRPKLFVGGDVVRLKDLPEFCELSNAKSRLARLFASGKGEGA